MKNLLKNFGIGILTILMLLFIIYLSGPKIKNPDLEGIVVLKEYSLSDVTNQLNKRNSVTGIKRGNEEMIIWSDSLKQKTKYALIYLHGFGASHHEGYPVHRQLADSLEANLYLARLQQHGLSYDTAFKGITSESYLRSAVEALDMGRALGKKIILMGTSTGASQAIWLAANYPDMVDALVLYSPYIQLTSSVNEALVLGPWGENILEFVMGGSVNKEERADSVAAYWSEYYHTDSYKALFSMIDATMKDETFQKVKQPVFLGYYYKNEKEQDQVVSVPQMNKMFDALSSSTKKKIAFPEVGNHVIASSLRSKNWPAVRDSTLVFLKSKVLEKPL